MTRISDLSELPQSPAPASNSVGHVVWPIIAVWFLAMLGLSLAGRFDTHGAPPILLGLVAVGPVLLFFLCWSAIPSFRAYALNLDPRRLTWVQSVRIIGAVFLVLSYRGILPGAFANPAGWGDIAVGVTAPLVALNFGRLSKPAIVAWNLFGMLDLITAITMGVLSSQGPLGILAHDVTTRPMGQFPLSLIPTFAVPLLFIDHLIVLFQLRRSTGLPPDEVAHHAS